jgi:amino acid adenylation domain-containing protein/non-ribosomal peptide synthase protein (TIGR01720 family)
MASQYSSTDETVGRLPQLADIEPCIFPSFDVGEDDDQAELLSVEGELGLMRQAGQAADQTPDEICNVLRAAWGVLLGCYTGLETVYFGFEHPVAEDDDSSNNDVTTTISQLHIAGDQPVQQALTGSIVGQASLLPNTNDTPFNTLLSIRENGEQAHRQAPLSPWCKVRVTVDLSTLTVDFSWVPSFMTREQAMNVTSTYEKIVSEIVARPGATISELDCFSERNLVQVLEWNSNAKNNVTRCIHQIIAEQGAERPAAEAVCAWDGSFSYTELLSLADRLACRLRESGVAEETFVPICFDKSRWTVVAMLAVLKAGGIFVPLDPTHPVPRLQALAHKVGAKTLLCSRHHMGMLETVATELIPVDEQLFEELPEHSQTVDHGSSQNGAYMIFTSGTTGEPKGALIEHGSLLSSALAHGPAMMMDSNTRSLQFAASTFDVSITEILTCLILGGCVCVPSEEARLNDIETAITELRANWALLTPTFVKFINPDNVACLKTLVTGGEAMTQAIIRSWSHINLINCYGPAETSVVSHVHRGMTEGKNPLNIGRQVGIHCWVVDRYNHHRLMPIGAVGELVIEGHTLAREYYKEPEKTADAFVHDPEWIGVQPDQAVPRRMYKTGDLVKYNSDGSFHIAGRKDTQIKFHGQRIELGEIEHHLNVSPSIKHGMVILPKEGFCKGRLLTIVQLCDILNQDLVPRGEEYKLIQGELEETASEKIKEVKQFLTERLPPYMIPSMWIAVEFIPRLQSGKLDRKRTGKWVDDMSEALFRQLNPVVAAAGGGGGGSSEDLRFASETELQLHGVWSHVLNLNRDQLGLRQSFLSVGGDSISAMQVMSECRKRGLGLTVRHIIASRSISELAAHVKAIETPLFHKEILEQPFELSPIQKLYFARANHSRGHYNQSFLLRTDRRILASDMRAAIETVIGRHSMLRARFGQNAEGEWQQRVTNEVASSYRLRTYSLGSADEVDEAIADSQTCLDATSGPLFAADLVDMNNGEEELLFVVAHHLVIDLVSWRVILQELEDLLLRPQDVAGAERPLPFQTWCKMQAEHCHSLSPEQVLPVEGIPDGNAAYWGMESTPTVYGQMERAGFEVGAPLTSLLLSKCHEALRTEIPDVLLAAMIFSFGQTFTDRPVPPVFAEGHGREAWDPSIDLSNVVGWFTTIYPVFAGSEPQASLLDAVRRVKDGRRAVPDKGRPYFASRWLTPQGRDAFARHWPLEVTFNYLGQYQQLERKGALFTPVRDIAGEVKGATAGADVGPDTTCISLFEVSAVILKGSLRFSFVFNQNMKHQDKIRQWISSCERNLSAMIEELSIKTPEPTLSDFPLLSLTYDRLNILTSEKLPEVGVTSLELVEDAYPCSPMQSGLLVSTTKNRAFYAAYTLHEVTSRSGAPVDTARLADAWRRMVEFHPILRTIFVESVSRQDSLYDQVVLKEVGIPLVQMDRDSDEEAIAALSTSPLHQEDNTKLLHHFAICTSRSGKVFCRLDISHIIMDGTSMSIVFRDLALAYEGSLASGDGPLYRNYIKYLSEQSLQPGLEYWTSYLAGIEPCHFPVLDDGNVVEEKELRYVRVTFAELTELQSLCDERGVTIVNAIYAAWALTLRLYAATEEVCFGYLTSARDAPIDGVRDVVGPVINMVACRLNVASGTTLGDIMATVQRDYLDSLAYRHIPLAEVQHALHLSNTALFNTALSYRKLPPPAQSPPEIAFEECRPTYDPDEYNVSINIEAGEKDMAIDLMYWTDTLSDGQAANVAGTFTQALSNILHHCERPVAELEHLGAWNREQIHAWNHEMPAAEESCVHHLVQAQGARRPDAPAIASWDMDFSYGELDAASTKLANHIKSLGVGLEDFVLVCFEKSAFTIVAMMAILKAGGACVPLDPAHPDAALQLRADDTGASIALVSPTLVDRFSTLVDRTVAVDAALLESLTNTSEADLPRVTPRNACFVIYTSGSTGKPKGVVLEHRGLSTNARYTGPLVRYEQDSRVLQFASYTFDNSLAEIFTTLAQGGCVCVPSDHERLNDLAGAINRMRVTLADITPTVATFLNPGDVPTLKTLALGGEAVTVKCVEIWRDHVSLQCCYGPSECSVNSTYTGDIAAPGKATNIGRAVGSVAWVVDPNDHNCLLPIGCTGELLIDGPIVSRGYLNLPDKTAQSFIPAPAWRGAFLDAGALNRHIYKTGDLVRYDSDGTLMYLGRKDTQVKLNGQRIELGEIEHHIEQNLPEGAASAVELVVIGGKKSLACFICVDMDGSVPATNDDSIVLPMYDAFKTRAKELEVILSSRIPAYMIPTIWLPIAQMPLTSSGKLNRRALRTQGQEVPPALLVSYKLATKSGRAASTETEMQLARMWAAVLGVEAASIGVEDNFFKLGGDSISAMKLVTQARAEDMNLTVASIFQKSTLLDMAEAASPMSKVVLANAQPYSLLETRDLNALKREVAAIARIRPQAIQDVFPCTAVQEGLMALSIREPGAYVAQLVYRLPEGLDINRFKQAWGFVVRAEPSLRTRIVHTEDAGFLQMVIDESVSWTSISSLSDLDDSERRLPSHNGGKLTNYAIAGEGSSSVYFVWTIHHALYDGWCLPLILDRVKESYENLPVSGLASGPSYANFIRYIRSLDSAQTDQFWKTRLADVSAQQFPRLPNPEYQASASSLLVHRAPLGRKAGSEITVATRIRAAWALTVASYTGATDVVFWETLTGRDAPVPGIEDMVGATLSTVPTRVSFELSKTVSELLRAVQGQSADATPHQYAGIQRIKRLDSDTAIACGAQNLIAINNGSRSSSDMFWQEQTDEMAGTNFYTYPLMLSSHIEERDLETVVHFDANVISEWQMKRVMDHFASVLDLLSSDELSGKALGELDMLSPADVGTLKEWNSSMPALVDRQIHEVIQQQVAQQQQDKLAVVSWDASLTYAELDSLSSRLASVLIDEGIGSSSTVPLCFEKSSLVIISMLAVLKSGAAFVPLDPAHPDARIRGILDDVEATVILCSPKHAERCASLGPKTIAVSQTLIDGIQPQQDLASASSPGSAAYVIFTSGTTGKPKGTIVEHAAFCTGAIAHGTTMGISQTSRVLQFASYTFDASIMEILTTLIMGGTVCVPSDEERINDIVGVINRLDITWTLLTPSVAQLIQPSQVPGLKTLVLGGEAMSSAHIATWSSSSVRLMNAYGPSETSVIATINPYVTFASGPSDIGRAVGGVCWVTDPSSHDRLVPIGAIGELVVEGPILARGYLKNPEKTDESFIVNPRWTSHFPADGAPVERRMYKTGDLVKLGEDGSFLFQGRKDNQVKLNGQRMELAEVEHHIGADKDVQHGLAAIPSSGPCKKRLVAILSLKSLVESNSEATAKDIQLVGTKATASYLTAIRERVASHLPSYMVPSRWIIVDHLPLLPSGKLDRRRVVTWVEEMSNATHQLVCDAEESAAALDRDASDLEIKIRAAWAKVLNMQADKVPFNQSFLHLGGDSISAMQMMSACRSSNISVTVPQIMQSKSIVELATRATAVEEIVYEAEEENKPFGLSPIQKVFFKLMGAGSMHFNQSVLLGTTRTIRSEDLSSALECIIDTHSMLRARFSAAADGAWSQRITGDVKGSYRLRAHTGVAQSRLSDLIGESQRSLDIVNGPLFAADIFDLDNGEQAIALVAHHLVVDVVSWHIILQDLESIIKSAASTLPTPLSFQTWNALQTENSQDATLESVFHGVEMPQTELSYWGMQDVPNVTGDAISQSFDIEPEQTRLLMGPCHEALQTDVADVLLASLLGSFRQAFSDRLEGPAVFNEGHGREPWDEKLDLSRTVGWFTTLCPIYLPQDMPAEADILDLVTWIKDFRRKVPGKGRPYFAHSLLSEESQRQLDAWPVEIAFNFLGQTQSAESGDSPFKSLDGSLMDSVNSQTDIGDSVPRLSLIEITASVFNGSLNFSFSFNRHMKRQDTIRQWVDLCQTMIVQAVDKLSQAKAVPTMADFPLLPLAFGGVRQIEEKLANVGIGSLKKIETAYPCSPVQQGILFTQIKNPNYYAYSVTFEVKQSSADQAVDVQRLANAWKAVVKRHSTLRTVFVGSLLQEGSMDQVVLKKHHAAITSIKCSDEELPEKLAVEAALGLPDNQPPHRLRICKTDQGRVFCVLEMSHAIADGTSMPILFQDLALAYSNSLPSATVSAYGDYIAYLHKGASVKTTKYWKNYLSGVEPCYFPTLNDGVSEPKKLKALDQAITNASDLQAFCTERGFTLSNVLQLAWALVLQAYTGLDDVCFGYLVAGRDIPVSGIDEAVGVFINMLVCRVQLNPATSVGEVLAGIQSDLMTGMLNKQVSLADVQHGTNAANAPLFNTAYSFQRRSVSKDMAAGDISFDISDAQDPSEYDITVNVEVWDARAELQLCYWSNKISDAQAKNIASTFDQVLSSIVAFEAATPIGDINVLSEHCSQQLAAWNQAQPELRNECVHHVFEQNARSQPDNTPAVDAWDAQFTYNELDVLASRLAQELVTMGVRAETYIPLCFQKSAWTVVAMMAVLKAGGAFVPLDPTHPPERINYLLENVDAKLVLCSPSLVDKFESTGVTTYPVGKETMAALSSTDGQSIEVSVAPHNPAYIIFTSGTTGLPKGTIIEHGAFATGGIAHAHAIKMTSASRVLQFASHTFDASIMEILSTLLVGGCICIPSDEDRLNDLAAVINKFNITWTLLTPSVANVLKPGAVPSLKVLVTGGEAMSRDHITKWANEASLVNAYGPSEASVIAAAGTKVDETGAVLNKEPACIGHAVGSRSWIVDPRNHDRLMPIGSIGELVIEGPIVARGYLNNEAKTSAAFIEHPAWRQSIGLSGDRTDRMYKTGDLVAYNSDGSFNYIARKDTQIKLNGQRIELGEIEHHVKANLPADVQSVVDLVIPQSKTSTKALAVFFTSEELSDDDSVREIDEILLPMSSTIAKMAESLKSALQSALPSYMLPTIYMPVKKMPWTLSGKLDRARLKAMVKATPLQQIGMYKLAGASLKRKPTTLMEVKLQKVWQKVLNVDEKAISKDDSFFRLGGDSVGAMKLVAAARTVRIALTVLDAFRHPKLSDMAMHCGQLGDSGVASVKAMSMLRDVASPAVLLDELADRCGVQKSQIQDVYPCSSLQEGLVALSLQQPGAYVAENVFELPVDVDLDRFKQAWQRTVDQVDILRARIVNAKSAKFYQVVLQPHPIVWNTASSLGAATGTTSSVPGRNGGALAQYTLVAGADSQARYFVWTVHHALYDAWSMPTMMKLVEDAYAQSQPLSASRIVPFANFVKYLADVDVEASNQYWRSRFQDASPTHFPAVLAASAQGGSTTTLRHAFRYSKGGLDIDITVPTVVRAAWALVIGSQTGSDDVVFGETLSGRDIALHGVGDILGPTLTTVPTRVEIDRDITVRQFLKTLHEKATEVIPFQHAGLQNLKRLGSTVALACGFNNLLVIQSAEETAEKQALMQPLDSELEQDSFFTYPLVVECAVEAEGLHLTIHHNESVISGWQVKRIVHQFDALVQQLIDMSREPIRKVAELRLCGPEDIKVINEWNAASFDHVANTVPALFMETAARQPDKTAICAWNGELTYDQVRVHATRLAKVLVAKGVGAETFVPCCMDRGVWTTVSMLAILMAGGAVIPFDPAHPHARHEDITRDCRATVVLSSAKYQDRFANNSVSVIIVDEDLFNVTLPCEESSEQALPVVDSQDAAFVIYTSGSTGKPKGVVIEHHSFCTSSKAFMSRMNLVPTSRVFHFTSYAFDIAMGETFGCLTSGACLCIPSEEMRTTDVAGAMNMLQATWAFLTPSVANILEPSSFTTLQTLVCGGEALTPETIKTWADKIELMNGYGPAECTVFCVSNSGVSAQKDHTNIGRAMDGNHTWVVDPRDHNYLVPLGGVGELLIDGPIVARGYLNDDAKTAQSFIQDPEWVGFFRSQEDKRPVRLYKTGDLVKYLPDGSLCFMGRKDHQVKLHGQRMELGEIEANLEPDHRIRHALVNLPKTGICKGRLVAVVSLNGLASANSAIAAAECIPVSAANMEVARTRIAAIQDSLSERLPPYMVPTAWLVVEAIPLLVSGKLDRTRVQSWVNSMDMDTYKRAMGSDGSDEVAKPETPTGQLLRAIWASILAVSEETLPINQSFISMGGDSITAMQVMTRCRDHSIKLSLMEIIKSKSITDLAKIIDTDGRRAEVEVVSHEEELDVDFELSPVQQLYFGNSADKEKGDHFNQSQLLQLRRKVQVQDFEAAVQAIVQKHSMLRSRFRKASNGEWTQRVTQDVESSYSFNLHSVASSSDMTPIISSSQKSIDIISGPLFKIDLFEMPDETQVVSLIAHHLVIDVVSWLNILQDLETCLTTGAIKPSMPFSFQSWCAAQAQQAKALEVSGGSVLPFPVGRADLGFWGMSDAQNVYGDVARQSFVVSEADVVSLALGACHAPLKTEPLDLFISSVLQSFGLTFAERHMPTLFNEGHGREPWDHSIDISQTVGWFTALCPVQISLDSAEDCVDSIRRVKDVRRSIPSNGRPYFAYRYLTESGRREFSEHEPMEILVNYLGRTQQTSKNATLLEAFDYDKTEEDATLMSDVGTNTARMALFEISISITDNGIEFLFMYNSKMLHEDRITQWIANCKTTLVDTARKLGDMAPAPTLSDLPLLPLNYAELQKLVTKSLPALQVQSFDDVEDIYPCSPMQTGMLLSQLQDPGRYLFHTVMEILPAPGAGAIDAKKLAQACKQVVNRHAALRTVFTDSVYRGGSFDQVVLKPRETTRISVICCKEIEVMAKLNSKSLEKTNRGSGPMLPYQITICQTPQGKVFMKFEMNHTVTDGASTGLVLREVAMAYNQNLSTDEAPSYKEYIKYISAQSMDSSLNFWTSYLQGAEYTEFPAMNRGADERSLGSVTLDFGRFAQLQTLCATSEVTLSSVILSAWALMLRSYTKLDDVCFGYLASGRDARIDNIHDIVGPFINMLVVRFQCSPKMLLKSLFQRAQEDYLAGLPHQHFSLARVNHALGMKNKGFFNTAVSIQNAGSADADASSDLISYESIEAHDPSEYAVTMNVNTTRNDEGVVFRYWTDVLSEEQAEELAKTFSDLLDDFIDHSEEHIVHLRLAQDSSSASISTADTESVSSATLQRSISDGAKDISQPLLQEMFRSERRKNGLTANGLSKNKPVSVTDSPRLSATKKLNDAAVLRDMLEEKLTVLWKETLGLETSTLEDHYSFFELGGDSIIAMSMVGSAREEGIPLTVADIFKNPCFGDMLQCLLSRSAEDYEAASSDSETVYSKKDSGLAEEELYEPFSLLDQKDPEQFVRDYICPTARVSRASIADVLPTTDFQAQSIAGSLLDSRWMLNHFYLDGSGSLDIGLLRESIANVVASYDILRTVFVPHEDRYLQVVLRQLYPDIRVYENVDNVETFTAELEENHRDEMPQMGEPYVRFIIALEKSTQHHRIFIRLSHAQYDGVCFPAILEALKACYDGEVVLPAPSYAKFVRGALGKVTPEHYSYWRNLLRGSAVTDIVPREHTALTTSPTEVLKQVVPTQSLAALNITTATIVKAAWSMVLSQVTGKSDVVFGHIISGRNIAGVPGIESIVGPCLNTVPVRVRHQTSWTVLQLLQYIQSQQVDNMPFESLGFREMIEKCTDWDESRAVRGFSTMLQHQSMAQTSDLVIGGNTYRVGAVASQEDPADFSVVTTPVDANNIEVCLIYARDGAIAATFAEKIFSSFCQAITAFSEDPDASLGSYLTISPSQEQPLDDMIIPGEAEWFDEDLKNELCVLSDTIDGSLATVPLASAL